ncbi:MAG: type II secretion system F family protein [Reyranellaceae bacterium]
MLPTAVLVLLIFLLATCSAGSLMLAGLYPRLVGRAALDRRIAAISAAIAESAGAAKGNDGTQRKRSVEETLREAEEEVGVKLKRNSKPTLTARLRQADLAWRKNTYHLVCLVVGVAVWLASLFLLGLGMVAAVAFGIVGGLLLPHGYVGWRRGRRFKRFSRDFPNAVDVIVRGVRAGLPLIDCLNIVASEAREPIRSLFKTILEEHSLGVPLDEAIDRLPDRMPLPEASFFSIVIGIQARTGGGLSEALANLSNVLRGRKKMRSKIKALSAEAVAAAIIIGAMPVAVAGLLYLITPDYIAMLFNETMGRVVLFFCGLWMLMGILVMRKMVNFSI